MPNPAIRLTVLLALAAMNFSPSFCRAQSDGTAGEVGSVESAPEPLPEPVPMSSGKTSRIGIGVKISLLGVGIEVGTPLGRKFNIRGGFNFLNYNRTFSKDGIPYAGKLSWRSGEANLDWFPFGGFHLSPGLLFYDGNKITANVSVASGSTFSLNGTTYESGSPSPLSGVGSLSVSKVAPTFRMGFGNLIPRNGRHWSFLAEVGVAYQGSPRVALNFAGTVCMPPNTSGPTCVDAATDATVQGNIQGEQTKLNNDVKVFKFYPLLSLGVGFNF